MGFKTDIFNTQTGHSRPHDNDNDNEIDLF